MTKTKILYIMGNGRSGSTILGNILNEITDFFTVGELRQLWEVLLHNHSTCACGKDLYSCEIWRIILASIFTDSIPIDSEEMLALYNQYGRNRHVLRMLFPAGRQHAQRQLTPYLANLSKLYQVIADVTHSSVIVDTSKHPSYGAILDMLSDVDVYVVHLVRDPRAVAYSWGTKKFKPDEGIFMIQLPVYKSALRWLTWNLGGWLLWRCNNKRYLRIYYEDFTRQPRVTIEQISQFIDEPRKKLPFTSEDEVLLGPNHIAMGNPNRMDSIGIVQIKYDARWKTRMSALNKGIVTLITFPLLVWYRYLFGRYR